MKSKLEQPATSDADLFQQALEGVIPLTPSNRIPPPPPVKRYIAHSTAYSPVDVPDTLSDHGANDVALTSYLRNGLNKMTLRKLRRGQWPIQDTIDLHGSTSSEARKLLADFLHHAFNHGLRCVNVIHGKGWRTEGGEGVLKIRVRHWLTQYPQVLAFCEAPAHAGGGGAVWLLLVSEDKIIHSEHGSSQ